MDSAIETLITEITLQNERIAELEHTLEQLKSQLLDTHEEDSVIITIINNALNKENKGNQKELLIAFFMHFRNKGEQNISMTIEEFVDDYLSNL